MQMTRHFLETITADKEHRVFQHYRKEKLNKPKKKKNKNTCLLKIIKWSDESTNLNVYILRFKCNRTSSISNYSKPFNLYFPNFQYDSMPISKFSAFENRSWREFLSDFNARGVYPTTVILTVDVSFRRVWYCRERSKLV